MTRLGYQMPNFTYPGVDQHALFDVISRQAVEAESSGFDTVLVMDHFFQLPMLGPATNYMLECYTTLAALSGVTSEVRLSALVTGNTYRNPAVLAKTVTTLDVVSRGRAQLGIGAGWFQQEHDAFGIPSARLPTASASWRRPCRSSCRCCATAWPTSPAGTTRRPRRSTRRHRWGASR